jgi:hypothetical protein
MLARGAAVRLLPHGPLFIGLFALVMGIVSGCVVLALRAMFEKRSEILTYDALGTLRVVLQSALATALVAPPIFGVVKRIDAGTPQKPEDRASLA